MNIPFAAEIKRYFSAAGAAISLMAIAIDFAPRLPGISLCLQGRISLLRFGSHVKFSLSLERNFLCKKAKLALACQRN
ncbi:MAG: hypothetical protein IKV82_07595 [Akkermansia sp.]|nr:hypothetical protein [Akkermansia sp.]